MAQVRSEKIAAGDPFHAKTVALLQTLRHINQLRDNGHTEKFTIYSDCKNLVEDIRCKTIDDIPSWKAAESVAQCLTEMEKLTQLVTVQYVGREAFSLPHRIANQARMAASENEVVEMETLAGIDRTYFTVTVESMM